MLTNMFILFDRLTLTTDTGNLQEDVYSNPPKVVCVMPKRKVCLLLLNTGRLAAPLKLWSKSPPFLPLLSILSLPLPPLPSITLPFSLPSLFPVPQAEPRRPRDFLHLHASYGLSCLSAVVGFFYCTQ